MKIITYYKCPECPYFRIYQRPILYSLRFPERHRLAEAEYRLDNSVHIASHVNAKTESLL